MTSAEVNRQPYFQRDDVLRSIEQIAEQRSLVIYAGAGVSIDKTGLAWPDLVDKLMIGCVDPSLYEIVRKDNPLQSASIVKQMYIKSFGVDRANMRIAEELRTLLYPSQIWERAELAHAVVRLAAQLQDHRKGGRKKVGIVTTNYDDFLEQQVVSIDTDRERNGERLTALKTTVPDYEVEIENVRELRRQVQRFTAEGQILHLHGYVSQDPAEPLSTVTFSEVDYARSYRLSAEILEQLLRAHSLLVIGTSLTDPPLLRALARTREEAAHKGLLRIATVPLQSLNVSVGDTSLVKDIQQNLVDRMDHFGVEVTCPDFYSQVTQLLTEIRICASELDRGGSYVGSPVQYGNRLRAWWTSWKASRYDSSAKDNHWEEANRRDHALLLRRLVELQEKFGLVGELMKLEIWIRWEPSTSNRYLKLWASSTGTWPDEKSMRKEMISSTSEYASVITFCRGRPDILLGTERRWRKYLCVPVKIGAQQGHDLPVAVISLASMDEHTRIRREYAAQIAQIANALARIGDELV